MKTLLVLVIGVIFGAIINFVIFMVAYKKLVFPLLHEDQRMDIAPYLLSHVLPSYFLSSLIFFLVLYFLTRWRV